MVVVSRCVSVGCCQTDFLTPFRIVTSVTDPGHRNLIIGIFFGFFEPSNSG
jgi:hypothetical protein